MPGEIKLGMSFGTPEALHTKLEKDAQEKGIKPQTLYSQWPHYNSFNKDYKDLGFIHLSSGKSGMADRAGTYYSAKHDGLIYSGENRRKFYSNGAEEIKNLRFNTIIDRKNNQYAIDLNKNNIVDEGEIFNGEIAPPKW